MGTGRGGLFKSTPRSPLLRGHGSGKSGSTVGNGTVSATVTSGGEAGLSSPHETILPKSDRLLLRLLVLVVPLADRSDWLCLWEAELWWRRYHLSCEAPQATFTDLTLGLCGDALWLRLAWCRQRMSEAALPCSLVLGSAGLMIIFLDICHSGDWYLTSLH